MSCDLCLCSLGFKVFCVCVFNDRYILLVSVIVSIQIRVEVNV